MNNGGGRAPHSRHPQVNYHMPMGKISYNEATRSPDVQKAASHHGVSVHDIATIVKGGATIAEALLTLSVILL